MPLIFIAGSSFLIVRMLCWKKALIYPDTYRAGEDGLKRFDWGICGREFFCKYALKKLQIEKYPDMCGHGHKHNYRLYKFQLL